jgi:sugar lactone lactonase YvrE
MVVKWMTAGLAAIALSVAPAYGVLATTPAGTAAGFGAVNSVIGGWSEQTTASTGQVGPLGMVITSLGTLLVTDSTGNVYSFASDANGQTFVPGSATASYAANDAVGLANIAGVLYMSEHGNHDIVKVNNTGVQVGGAVTTISPQNLGGLIVDPATNHLIVSGDGRGIFDVNPTTGTSTVIEAGGTGTAAYDGIALSADDKTLYAADVTNQRVVSINLTTDAITSLGTVTNPDGIAVGTGARAGNIYVNTNGGQFIQISLSAGNAQTVIATGGSRGDFVYVDPCGKILITQSDSIVTFGTGCGLFSQTPEPGTFALLGIGMGLVGLARRRHAL